jgi:hypothetical protein
MSTTTKRRRTRTSPQQHAKRLLRILTANLATATSPELRRRLEAAIRKLEEKRNAA